MNLRGGAIWGILWFAACLADPVDAAGRSFACLPQPVIEQHRKRHAEQLNALRKRNDLAPFHTALSLDQVAQSYACLLAETGHFGHEGPDGSGLAERVSAIPLDLCGFAENLARGQRSVGEALAGWVQSDGHRRNLFDPDLGLVGFGLAPLPVSSPKSPMQPLGSLSALSSAVSMGSASGGEQRFVWVQVFGRACKHP